MTRDIVFDVDISQPIVPIQLHEPLYYQNNNAHRIVINLTKNGVEYTPASGHTVTGYFVNEVEQKTQPLGGSISGSHLYVTLIQACYAVPTRGYILVNLSKTGSGASTTTVLYLAVNVLRSKTDAIVDPGGTIPDIDTLRAYVTTMQTATDEAETARDLANAAAARAETAADSLQDMVDTAVNNAGYPYNASGSSVTVHPVADSRIDFIAHIDPVQAGSGDPSPSNVRAITAPGSVKVRDAGANLFNLSNLSAVPGTTMEMVDTGVRLHNDTAATYKGATYGISDVVTDGMTFTLSAHVQYVSGRAVLAVRNASDNRIVHTAAANESKDLSLTYTYSADNPTYLTLFCTGSASAAGDVTYTNVSLVIGNEAPATYTPYAGIREVTLTLPNGTYGGDYDSHGGFVPMRFASLTSASRAGATAGSIAGQLYISNGSSQVISTGSGITDVEHFFCSIYKVMPYAAPEDRQDGCIYFGNTRFYIYDTAHMTSQDSAGLDAYFSWLDTIGGMSVCAPYHPSKAPAATDVDTKTLRAASPAQLNHVWTNNGTLTVSGPTDLKWLIDSIKGS